MPSIRLFRAIVVAVVPVVGAIALVLPTHADATAPGQAADRGTHSDRAAVVDLSQPENLPVGAPPKVAYVDRKKLRSPIFRPGKSALAAGRGRYVNHLMRVRGGYIVTIYSPGTVRFVADDGRRKTLAHLDSSHYVVDAVASGDGRLVAITVGRINGYHQRVTVRRVSTCTWSPTMPSRPPSPSLCSPGVVPC